MQTGDEVHYQNAVYKVVHEDDKVYLEFYRNKYGGYPPVYDIDALIKEG